MHDSKADLCLSISLKIARRLNLEALQWKVADQASCMTAKLICVFLFLLLGLVICVCQKVNDGTR